MPPNRGLREHLEKTGILDWGTPDQIEAEKRVYRRRYQRMYKAKRRLKRPEVVVSCKQVEYTQLRDGAEKHQIPLAPFIKMAALAYLEQRFLMVHKKDMISIREMVAFVSYDIKRIREAALEHENVELAELYHQLLGRIRKLEIEMREKLERPALIHSSALAV